MPQKTIVELDELTEADENAFFPIDSGIQTFKMGIANLLDSANQQLRVTTTERDAIASPVEAMERWNETVKRKQVYDGTRWVGIGERKKVVSKTTTYTATVDDDVILCGVVAAWTLSLPPASGATGRQILIKKTSDDFNALTIDGDGSETIDGAANTTLNTIGESVLLVSDGSNWQILERRIPSVMTAWTPTYGGIGGPTSVTAYWARVGDRMRAHVKLTTGTVSALTAQINFPTDMPAVDSTKMGGGALVTGSWYRDTTTATQLKRGTVVATAGLTYVTFAFDDRANATSPLASELGSTLWPNSAPLSFLWEVPITGWNG